MTDQAKIKYSEPDRRLYADSFLCSISHDIHPRPKFRGKLRILRKYSRRYLREYVTHFVRYEKYIITLYDNITLLGFLRDTQLVSLLLRIEILVEF